MVPKLFLRTAHRTIQTVPINHLVQATSPTMFQTIAPRITQTPKATTLQLNRLAHTVKHNVGTQVLVHLPTKKPIVPIQTMHRTLRDVIRSLLKMADPCRQDTMRLPPVLTMMVENIRNNNLLTILTMIAEATHNRNLLL